MAESRRKNYGINEYYNIELDEENTKIALIDFAQYEQNMLSALAKNKIARHNLTIDRNRLPDAFTNSSGQPKAINNKSK